jgi:hypothetical protein
MIDMVIRLQRGSFVTTEYPVTRLTVTHPK